MNSRTVGLLLFVGLFSLGCPMGPEEEDTLEITGHVYASVTCSQARGCTPSGPPIPGAVVSTSLDSQTAVTDAAGYFELRSGSTVPGCQEYTIIITAGGHPTFSVTGVWGARPRDQVFGLSPANPQGGYEPCG
jgi:hypothetical protein